MVSFWRSKKDGGDADAETAPASDTQRENSSNNRPSHERAEPDERTRLLPARGTPTGYLDPDDPAVRNHRQKSTNDHNAELSIGFAI